MLDARSALFETADVVVANCRLNETQDFTLTQVAGPDKLLAKLLGKLPPKVGLAVERDGRTLLRIGPKQMWVVGDAPQAVENIYTTPLSSGRSRFHIQGADARRVLQSLAFVDFHAAAFKVGAFVQTGVHHIPVLIHCIGADQFHVYVLRSFAQDMWEWISDAMRS